MNRGHRLFFSIKHILAVTFAIFIFGVLLTGCMAKVVEVTVVVKNATDFTLRWVVFDIPQ
jgi:hypothetical protein